nr:MAG TPA: hypothetical protein [Bacteriophage sp.]
MRAISACRINKSICIFNIGAVVLMCGSLFRSPKIQTCREPLPPHHDKIMAECQK